MRIRASVRNTLQYDSSLCIGCGMCVMVCPHAVFVMEGRLARLVRPDACMECGACELNCPPGALVVDSGVGCAAAMIRAALTGQKQPACSGDAAGSCCGGTELSSRGQDVPPSSCCGG